MEKTLTRKDIDVQEITGTDEETDQGVQLIVHNDNINTFDWVIQSLIEICDHSENQAEQCSIIIHFKGKACVKSGVRDKLRPMRMGLVDRGISATIE